MMSGPVISVVMGSFNQQPILKKVLDGYNEQQTSLPFEVIVVDSSSTDGTSALFESFQANFQFTPIVQENKGKAAARNRGVRDAKSEIIVITDSDMIPDLGFI